MSDLNNATIKELVRLGTLTADVRMVGEIPYAVFPADCKVESLERLLYSQYNARPDRTRQTVVVLDGGSFVDYFSLFSDEHSRVFADETLGQVLAVLDYHEAIGTGAARWGDHRLRFDLRKSPEWLTWTAHSGQSRKMVQVEFAEFLEDNSTDVLEPSAATMLEMARTLEAKTDVDYQSSIRLNNGQVQLTYNETVKGTYGSGKVEIPEQFVVAIPVYVGTPRIRLTARLRYRLVGGKLSIWYDLLRADAAEREAFRATLDAIQAGIESRIINGGLAK